ncbi:MAG: enoyl-CoA hydratase/isomerase family protein [Solirubrobacteraceae bacterium]
MSTDAITTEPLIAEGDVLLDLESTGVGRIRLNRPKAANGMNVPFLEALHAAILRCLAEPRVKAVLLTGEGKNFCAGGDVREFASKGEALPEYLREATAVLQHAASALMRLEVPVIAAVQGFAAGGGGFGLVCAADLVIAGESSKYMSAATRAGMAPDAGTSVTLSKIVGFRRAMEIVLADRVLTAQEALEIGLVTKVVPDDALVDEALTLARRLAGGPTLALGETKRLMWEGLSGNVESRMPDEARTVSVLSGSFDAREGLAAVLERREPRYEGR